MAKQRAPHANHDIRDNVEYLAPWTRGLPMPRRGALCHMRKFGAGFYRGAANKERTPPNAHDHRHSPLMGLQHRARGRSQKDSRAISASRIWIPARFTDWWRWA